MTEGLHSLTWLGHSSFLIAGKKTIYFDPWNLVSEGLPKADIILITQDYVGHCSARDIKKIAKPTTIVVASRQTLPRFMMNHQPVEARRTLNILGCPVEVLPAEGPPREGPPTPDRRRLGFLLEIDGIRIYHAGDTGPISEWQDLRVDVALLPIGGGDTMTVSEAAAAVGELKPKIVVPMHWGSLGGVQEDAEEFECLCRDAGIACRILPKDVAFRLSDILPVER